MTIPSFRASPVRGAGSPADPGTFFLYFAFPGHANRREGILKRVLRRDNLGGLNLNSAGNTQVYLPAESARDIDFFGPVTSFPTRVYVTRTGTYRVTYCVNVLSSGSLGGSIKTIVTRNGGAGALVGSMAGIYVGPTSGVQQSCGSSFLNDCTSGDYLEIVATRVGALTTALNTIAGGSFMQVELVSFSEEALLGSQQYVERAGRIEKVIVTKGISGYSGTTYFDILRNGVTMVGSTKLTIASNENYKEIVVPSSLNKNVDVGDLITIDVVSEESPFPRDFFVSVKCRAAR